MRPPASTPRQVIVGAIQTSVGLTSSRPQSINGTPVTFTAKVGAVAVGYRGASATGTVTFYRNGTAIGTADVINGVATLTLNNLSLGTGSITASYSGDANYGTATSGTLVQQISTTLATTNVSVAAVPTLAAYGAPVVLTAILTGQGNPEGGTVSFYDGTTLLGTASLVNGKAVLSLSNLEVGSHTIKAVYSGDANNATSTSYTYPTITAAYVGDAHHLDSEISFTQVVTGAPVTTIYASLAVRAIRE